MVRNKKVGKDQADLISGLETIAEATESSLSIRLKKVSDDEVYGLAVDASTGQDLYFPFLEVYRINDFGRHNPAKMNIATENPSSYSYLDIIDKEREGKNTADIIIDGIKKSKSVYLLALVTQKDERKPLYFLSHDEVEALLPKGVLYFLNMSSEEANIEEARKNLEKIQTQDPAPEDDVPF